MRRALADILFSVAASGTVVIAVAVAGGHVVRTVTQAPGERGTAETACLERSVTPIAPSRVGGNARLCISDGAVQPSIQLENLTSGAVYTAWFAYFDRPSGCQSGLCASTDLIGDDPAGVLGRIDGAVADQAGRVHLATTFRDLRLSGGSEVQLLIVDHGPLNADDSRTRARQLLSWHPSWLGTPAADADVESDPGSVVGRGIFRLRGGVDSLDLPTR